MQASGRDLASADAMTTAADAVMDATSAVRAILRVQECSAIMRHHLSRLPVREERASSPKYSLRSVHRLHVAAGRGRGQLSVARLKARIARATVSAA